MKKYSPYLGKIALCAVLLTSALAESTFGQQQPPTPQLLSLYPAGGSAGTTFNVKIVEQTELEFARNLIFSHPGISSKPKMREKNRFFPKSTPVRNEFEVSIQKDVPAGIYEVRAQCEYGVSNPRRFVVSKSAEVLEVEPNNSFEQATELAPESTGNGLFEAGYDYYKVKVKPGQSLIFRCVAEQIDSKGDPVIAIFDSSHRMLAKNHDTRGKDALVSFQTSKEEEIYIRVNDLTFTSQGGAGTTPYRLTVSSAPWIDFVDPPVVNKNKVSTVRLFGRNLGGGQSGIRKNGVELESLEVTIDPAKLAKQNLYAETILEPVAYSRNRAIYQFQSPNGKSNPVIIDLADGELVLEKDAKNELKPGYEILGEFSKPGEIDHYRFSAKKGERFWIELVSQRLGIETDPLITLETIQKTKDGEEQFRAIGSFDDRKPMATSFRFRLETEDPASLFVAPSDGDYRISINDQFNLPAKLNGPNYYKLIFRRPQARVDLVAVAGLERGPNDNHSRPLKILPCIVRPFGGAEIQVFAYRAPGFEAPIELKVEGIPDGVTAHSCVINGKSNHGTIVLTGDQNLKSGIARIKVTGSFVENGKDIVVPVGAAEIVTNSIGNEPSESRLADSLLVITDSTVSYPGTIELSQAEYETAMGGIIQPKAKLIKNPKHTGSILQGFVHGLPRTVTKNSNTIPDNGSAVDYRVEFRQGSSPGEYSAFVRGYFEKNTKRFEKKLIAVTAEQKRLSGEVQKVESEYRSVSRERQTLTSKISQQRSRNSQLASATRSSATAVTNAEREVNVAETNRKKLQKDLAVASATVLSLTEKMNLEAKPEIKQKLADDLNQKKEEEAAMKARLLDAVRSVDTAKNKLVAAQSKLKKAKVDEDAGRKTIESLNSQLTEKTSAEKRLSTERTLGQTLKREIDQELNLARQAARDRRCRYLVYSKPFRIKVAEYPIELVVSKTDFVLEQGQSEKMKVTLKRLFGYKGQVSIQLRPGSGANGWSFKKDLRMAEGNDQAEVEVFVQKFARVGKFTGEIRATMRNGNTNLTKIIPVSFEVKAGK